MTAAQLCVCGCGRPREGRYKRAAACRKREQREKARAALVAARKQRDRAEREIVAGIAALRHEREDAKALLARTPLGSPDGPTIAAYIEERDAQSNALAAKLDEQPSPAIRLCRCARPIRDRDEDGDCFCVRCGRFLERPGPSPYGASRGLQSSLARELVPAANPRANELRTRTPSELPIPHAPKNLSDPEYRRHMDKLRASKTVRLEAAA